MPAFDPPPATDGDGAYRQVFHALDLGLVRTNLEGYLLEVNPRFAALLGVPSEALVGRHLADLTHPDDLAASLAQRAAALAGALRPFVLTPRLVRSDGQAIRMRIRSTLLRDADGRPLQFLSMVEDSQPQAVAPDTDSQAEPLPAAGFDLIAGMGHALRTPLHAMLGFAQLLRVDPSQRLSPDQRDKINHIERSGAQLLALMSDVIDLARIEAQRMPLQIQPWPLAPLLEEALASIAAAADQADVSVRAHLPGTALCVWADRDRLHQILLKLLHHALREPATRSGGRLLLEAQSLNHQVAITVSDTRHDLSAMQQTALFDIPASGRELDASDGTHLGLHIVRRLVALMQGRIEVASAPGQGTRLRVWLPQGQTLQPVSDEALPPRSAFDDLEGVAGEQSLTVLYAEDNVVNIELVRQVMRMRPQWRLEVAYCGQDAITMALRDPPDLLLLDMHLGDMSGLDVSNVLARQAHTAHIPRVALSADVLPDHIREARALGFVDYLTKPLDVGRFLRLLDRVAQLNADGDR